MKNIETDIVIIGGGISGLVCALELPNDCNIVMISEREPLNSGSSRLAQGGISISFTEEEIKNHINDTYKSGDELGDFETISKIITQSKDAFDLLEKYGVEFDRCKETGNYHKTIEGGHNEKRVFHIKDQTGYHICSKLNGHLLEKSNITQLIGVVNTIYTDDNNKITGICDGTHNIYASKFIFANGGNCGLFKARSAPAHSSSVTSSLFQLGCELQNFEFFQFHPTSLDLPIESSANFERLPLITEALRGEGGILVEGINKKEIEIESDKGSLATRDIVARAVFKRRLNQKRTYIDTTNIDDFENKFPNILNICKKYEINNELIPVRTSAHYQCGGIKTTITGKTNIDGLYVIGEAGSIGFHGANRLASNSLLEAVVVAHNCANEVCKDISELGDMVNSHHIKPDSYISTVRSINDNFFGIIRSGDILEEGIKNLKKLGNAPNITLSMAGMLMGLKRTESIGCHYRLDFRSKKNIGQSTLCYDEYIKDMKNL